LNNILNLIRGKKLQIINFFKYVYPIIVKQNITSLIRKKKKEAINRAI
jgi:hypothetical protein